MPEGYSERDAWLIEYYATTVGGVSTAGAHVKDVGNNTFIALRMNTSNAAFTEVGGGQLLYAEFTDVRDWEFQMSGPGKFFELYDLQADPDQLTNLYSSVSSTLKNALHSRLRHEWSCRGTS